jgi:TPP-dependent 2-oxoacid decarboxylase
MAQPTVAEYTLTRLAAPVNGLAVMGRYGITPRIFVLNNGLYGVEDVVSERGHAYDDLSQPLPEDVIDRGYKLRTPGQA